MSEAEGEVAPILASECWRGVSPVAVVVAVELGQSQFLQFDLQLLVFPLQVHDDAVQEVDLGRGRGRG